MFESWIVAHGGGIKTLVFFVCFAVLGLIEVWAPLRQQPPRRRQRWLANLVLTTINVAVVISLPLSLFSVALWSQKEGWGLLNVLDTPWFLVIVVSLLARAFISFFMHLLFHKIELLWRLHRVHHMDTEVDISTTVRFHPFEIPISVLIGVPIAIATGISPWVLMVYEILNAGVTVFSHSNLRLPAPIERVLRYFVVTPDLHRIHHSSWQPETDSNFGALFPIWDLVFGTFRASPRQAQDRMPLGLDEVRGGRESQLGWLLRSPFIARITSSRAGAPDGVPQS